MCGAGAGGVVWAEHSGGAEGTGEGPEPGGGHEEAGALPRGRRPRPAQLLQAAPDAGAALSPTSLFWVTSLYWPPFHAARLQRHLASWLEKRLIISMTSGFRASPSDWELTAV